MRMLIVVIGVRGSGKTTLINSLQVREDIVVLKPTTTRPRRGEDDLEYHFVDSWPAAGMAWHISVESHSYGMSQAELQGITDSNIGVTVFDPGALDVLREFRRKGIVNVVLIGLDTVSNLAVQHERVGQSAERRMNADSFQRQLQIVQDECDAVIRGDADTVKEGIQAIIDVLSAGGGLLDAKTITSLLKAGALLENAELTKVQPASYDLHLSEVVWCQGQFVDLSDANATVRIPPYSFVYVEAKEAACLPRFVAARFGLKVSLFFQGVILSNGPQVDPGYNGSLFCMLFNGSDVDVALSKNEHFATIEFCTTVKVTEGYKEHYQRGKGFSRFMSSQAKIAPGGRLLQRIDEAKSNATREIASQLGGYDRKMNLSIGLGVAMLLALGAYVGYLSWDLQKALGEAHRTFTEASKTTAELKSQLDLSKLQVEQAKTLLEDIDAKQNQQDLAAGLSKKKGKR